MGRATELKWKNMVHSGVYLPVSLYNKLIEIARKKGTSKNKLVIQYLEDSVKEELENLYLVKENV